MLPERVRSPGRAALATSERDPSRVHARDRVRAGRLGYRGHAVQLPAAGWVTTVMRSLPQVKTRALVFLCGTLLLAACRQPAQKHQESRRTSGASGAAATQKTADWVKGELDRKSATQAEKWDRDHNCQLRDMKYDCCRKLCIAQHESDKPGATPRTSGNRTPIQVYQQCLTAIGCNDKSAGRFKNPDWCGCDSHWWDY